MVINISKLIRSGRSNSAQGRPLYTSIPQSWGTNRSSHILSSGYRRLWNQLKTSPELIATINVPISDILGDRPSWYAKDGSQLGPTQLKRAEKFWRDNRGKEVMAAMLWDRFTTGDGFIWKGKIDKKQAMARMKEYFGSEFGNLKVKAEIIQRVDEDVKKTRVIDYVAASTVKIIHDQYEIKGYEQVANGITEHFGPEEIIHSRHMTVNGQVQGFSPVEALAAEIALLLLVKQNMLGFMRNGGTPDKIFILPKEYANSKNHRFLISQLQKYKRIVNSHGNLVFTGELTVQDLQGSPKDLEYKDLALYITSNIAYAFGIPVTRIPYLIGASASGGDAGGLSESGYWNQISSYQDDLEDLFNSQLFGELGWHIKLPRKYKQDEIREAQANSMTADTVTKYQSILAQNGKRLTDKKMFELLGFSSADVEEMPKEQMIDPFQKTGLMNQNLMNNKEVMKEPDNRKKADTKRNVANAKDNAGLSV